MGPEIEEIQYTKHQAFKWGHVMYFTKMEQTTNNMPFLKEKVIFQTRHASFRRGTAW